MVTRSTTVDRGDFLHFLYLCIGNVVKAKNWEVLATKKSSVTTLNQKTSDPASYPYVSFSIKLWAQRKAGSRNRASRFSPSHSPLRFTTHGHPRVTRVSRSPLCEKRSAWEEGMQSPSYKKKLQARKLNSQFAFFTYTIMHPVYPPKVCITVVSNFSWVLQSSQEKSKTIVMQHLSGVGVNKGALWSMWKWWIVWGMSGSRTQDLSHPKRESCH